MQKSNIIIYVKDKEKEIVIWLKPTHKKLKKTKMFILF